MPAKLRLRVVDSEKPHARDIARQKVAESKLGPTQHLVNQHEKDVKPMLCVDDVLHKSDPHYLIGKK